MQNVSTQKASDVPKSREQIGLELETFLNRRAEKTKTVSDEEIDAVIDETVDHARHCRG